jgi:hypothetical protein
MILISASGKDDPANRAAAAVTPGSRRVAACEMPEYAITGRG